MNRWTVPANIPVPAFGGSSLFGTFTQSIGENLARFPQGPPLQDKFWCGHNRTHQCLQLSIAWCKMLLYHHVVSMPAEFSHTSEETVVRMHFVPAVGYSSSRTTLDFLQLCFLARWGLPAMHAKHLLVQNSASCRHQYLVLSYAEQTFQSQAHSRQAPPHPEACSTCRSA